jgi:hypothetical protein
MGYSQEVDNYAAGQEIPCYHGTESSITVRREFFSIGFYPEAVEPSAYLDTPFL